MKWIEIRKALHKNNLKFQSKSFMSVRYHNTNESIEHFLLKARLFIELVKKGYSVFSEYEFKNGAVADLFVLDNLTVIEVQSIMTDKVLNQKKELYFKMKKPSVNLIIASIKEFYNDKKEFIERIMREVA